MAVLQKIRDKAGLAVSIIIALALLSFIIDPGTLESAMNLMSSKNDVGQIAGHKISYADFQENFDKYSTVYSIMNNSTSQDENTQREVREATWQNFLDKYMFLKNCKAAGIVVGDEEKVNLLKGDDPSPVIAQFFVGDDGKFSADRLVEFVQNIPSDESGRSKVLWNYFQEAVTTQQYYTKYGALFMNSNLLNALQMEDDVQTGNTTANVEFVQKLFGGDRDSTLVVPESKIKAYYDMHRSEYMQNASRDIDYVLFEVVPSASDKQKAREEFEEVYKEFAETDDLKAFMSQNSDRSLSDYWYTKDDLASVSQTIADFIFSNQGGASPIEESGDIFRAARVSQTAMVPEKVYVRHILLQGSKARNTADSLLGVIAKGADFSALAEKYSADKGSNDGDAMGNIGWMTQTRMIPGFESVMTAQPGKPFILNTVYGTHIVEVTERDEPVEKKRVAIFEKNALPSQETYNAEYAKASEFSALANGTLDGFQKAADSLGVFVQNVPGVNEGTSNYGSVRQAREVTRWVFDAKAGKCSDIITVNQNYFFVVALTDIHKEGYQPLAQVHDNIEEIIYNQMNAQKQCELIKAEIAGKDLSELGQMWGVNVETVPDLGLSSMGGGMSQDPALLGAAQVAPEGKISGPVAGRNAIFVLKVNSRENGSAITEEDVKNAAKQKAQASYYQITSTMKEAAGVKDNRDRFF